MGKTNKISFEALPENPLVSILMPAYNAERFIQQAIESTLAQTYTNWELLILDDASTDQTLDIIRSFDDERVRLFEHRTNEGYLHSCNELFTHAAGQFITFLDADDSQKPDRIEVCLHAFKTNGELGFITTDNERIDAYNHVISTKKTSVDYSRMAIDENYEVYFACASLVMRAEALKEVKGYHPFFKGIGGEDYHMIWELSRITTGFHLNQPLYQYRKHAAQNQFLMKDPLKYLMMDILLDIRKRILIESEEPLKHWEPYKEFWYEHARQNPSTIGFRQALEKLSQGERIQCFSNGIRALLKKPFSRKSWVCFARLTIRMLTPLETN